jgi:deoxyribose-phosphate aldolase
LQAGNWQYAERDLAESVRAADGALMRVIIESALFTPQEITLACDVARDGSAGFVKTSTKYQARGGATASLAGLEADAHGVAA